MLRVSHGNHEVSCRVLCFKAGKEPSNVRVVKGALLVPWVAANSSDFVQQLSFHFEK